MTSGVRALVWYARAVAASTWLLLIAGGLVTSTDSGLAVPDWPLSYGTLFPPMVGGIRYEHGHRLIAATIGLLILVLAVWVWRAEPRRWVRRLAVAALGGVVLQGVLGGLTVLWLLPPAVSVAHAVLGQTIFCLMVALAVALGPATNGWRLRASDEGWPRLRPLTRAIALLAAAQLVLGAIRRHTGLALSVHIAVGVILMLAALWSAGRARRAPARLQRGALRLAGLCLAQVAIGVLALESGTGPGWPTAHLAVGALLLAQAVLLAWDARWSLQAPAPHPGRRRLVQLAASQGSAFLELTKPRLSALVLMTTAAGFWVGWRLGEPWTPLWVTLAGTAGAAGGANALNQWAERAQDARMVRTRTRPLPAGRLAPRAAYRFGLFLITAGLGALVLGGQLLAAVLAAASVVSYLFIYTPLKRRTSLCTLAGAIPGALPPMIGWAAARHALGPEAWALFAVLFVWQLPHFLALATVYREDYAQTEFRLLPLDEPQGVMSARQMALYGLALVPVSLFPSLLGMAGRWYGAAAMALSLAFLVLALRAARSGSVLQCRRAFQGSIAYLPLLLAVLVWDKL